MSNKQITYKKTWLTLCLFFVALFSSNAQDAFNDSIENVVNTTKNDSVRVTALNHMAHQLLYSDLEKSLSYANRGYTLAKKTSNTTGQALSLRSIGSVYMEKNDLPAARKYFEQSIDLYRRIHDEAGMADTYNSYGKVYYLEGNFLECIKLYNKALRLHEKLGNIEQVAQLYANIGGIYANINDADGGIKAATRALEHLKKKPNKLIEATAIAALAHSYYVKRDFTKALQYNESMLQLCIELKNVPGESHCYNFYGIVYEDTKEYAKALEYYGKALELSQRYGDVGSVAVAKFNQAAVYYNMKNYNQSIALANEALDLFTKINHRVGIKNAYSSLSESYAAIHKYNLAYDFLQKHNVLNDSIFNAETQQQIKDLEVKYETEKKNQEIEILTQKEKIAREKEKSANAIADKRTATLMVVVVLLIALGVSLFFYFRQRKTRELQKRAELEQKALRAQMNPHFIFNSLNSIQRMYVEGENDMANEYMADFADLMRRILDNSNKNEITLKEEIHSLKLYLELEKIRCQGMMNYEIVIDDDIHQQEIKLPPLIIQPFTENAIWHGILPKKQPGLVRIHIFRNKDDKKQILCTITDDGVGIKENAIRNHEPKGVHITEQRLGTTVKIEPRTHGGTVVTLLIPVNS